MKTETIELKFEPSRKTYHIENRVRRWAECDEPTMRHVLERIGLTREVAQFKLEVVRQLAEHGVKIDLY